MMPTPIALLKKAANLDLKLGFEPPDTLTLQPASRCPPEFADALRAHKRQLLALLQLPFVMVYSDGVGETLFFCEDEATKAVLVAAGADQWSIYTKRELRQLIASKRVAPISQAELKKLHEIKCMFLARISPNEH